MINYNIANAAVFWWRFGYTGAIFIPVAYYHFYLSYFKKNNKIILYFIYAIIFFEIIYLWFFLGDIRNLYYVLPNVGLVILGISHFYYFLFFGMVKYIVISMVILISFFREFKKEKTSFFRRAQLKWLTTAFFVLFLGVTEWLPTFNIPLRVGWMVVPFFVGIIAYAILKYKLMDINVVIKKAFIYSVVIAVISGFITGISFLSSWFVERIPGFRFWTIPLLVAIVAFYIGNLFWRKSKQVEKAYEVEKLAHKELKHLSEVKDQFILATQHHLRTPLTIMRGYLSMILKKDKNISPEIMDYLNRVSNSTDRIIKLVNELLDVSQLEIGKKTLDIKSINIRKIIDDIVQEFYPEIQKKNLIVRIIPEDKKEWLNVSADQEKIIVVLSNLIDNAIKYTPHGEIVIEGKKTDSMFQVSIKDQGIGINTDEIPTLFTNYFERGEEAQKLYTTGRGIGLFITASIIKAHNGRIWAESRGLNKGSKFYIELPMVKIK